jgi:hypothetical protein
MKSTLPADENKRANWIIRPVNKQSPREGSIQDHTRNHSYHLRTFGRDISNIQDSKRLQKQPTPTAPAKEDISKFLKKLKKQPSTSYLGK